jgi:putative transposase
MIKHLIRHYGRGHLHFITFSCYRRLPLLSSTRARNLFVQILSEVRDRHGFSLVGYVVMPEHVHLLISEPGMGTPSTVVQVLKQRVSRRRRGKRRAPAGQLPLQFGREENSLRRFWQRRFYDFNVWSLKKRVEKLPYMHMNPLQRRLVAHPKERLAGARALLGARRDEAAVSSSTQDHHPASSASIPSVNQEP